MDKDVSYQLPPNWDMLSPVRQPGEEFEHYKERMKILKVTEKIYKRGINYTSRTQQGSTNN